MCSRLLKRTVCFISSQNLIFPPSLKYGFTALLHSKNILCSPLWKCYPYLTNDVWILWYFNQKPNSYRIVFVCAHLHQFPDTILIELDGCSHSHVDIVVFKASSKSSSFQLFLNIVTRRIAGYTVWVVGGWINTWKASAVRHTRVFALMSNHILSCCYKNVVQVGLTHPLFQIFYSDTIPVRVHSCAMRHDFSVNNSYHIPKYRQYQFLTQSFCSNLSITRNRKIVLTITYKDFIYIHKCNAIHCISIELWEIFLLFLYNQKKSKKNYRVSKVLYFL